MKVRVLDKGEHCGGKACLPIGEDVDWKGEKYMRYLPCAHCEGSGMAGKWLELPEFLAQMEQSKCPHEHVSQTGGFHFGGGEVWDDIQDVCDDCGQTL
jgi:hypothetical protein